MKTEKTNACRFLDKKKIPYEILTYKVTDKEFIGHGHIHLTEEDPKTLYKTLVAVGKSNKNYVFILPYLKTIDLKLAAKSVNEKNISLIKQKDLFPLTGYVRGGCSPLGMKKHFTTVVDSSVFSNTYVVFSGGKIGLSIKMLTSDFKKLDIKSYPITCGE